MACRLHHVRFYEPTALAIHCIALHPTGNSLALSRKDASIELWDLRGSPFMSRMIPGTPSASIEAMCWVKDRLLTTGLSGAIVEWDLKTLSPKTSVVVIGHAAWCIDVTKQFKKLAVGTEQGYINIYSVVNNSLDYEKIFDKQEGRILCCKFDPSGEILVTGSIETIRIWNVSSGQALHRMTTGRAERNKETIVWCLEVTPDLTIISGDSRGRLTFWDARLGEQIESFNTHKADVLSVCLSDDQNSLYCAGVDPLIINYTRVKIKHKGESENVDKWVKNIQRNIHQHDVRAMAILGNKLFSGGVDGYLAVSSFPPKVLIKHPPIQPNNAVIFCDKSKIVCLKYNSSIEMWQLGSALLAQNGHSLYSMNDQSDFKEDPVINNMNGELETNNGGVHNTNSGRRLQLAEGPKLLLRLTSQLPIVCHAIASNKKWIAYSTESQLRIFKFTMVDDTPTLSKLIPLPAECIPCYRMAFSPDSSNLILATADASIKIIRIHEDGAVTAGQNINSKKGLEDSTITHLLTSESGNKNNYYLVAADVESNIGVWEVEKGSKNSNFVAHLPRYKFPPSAIAINKQDKNIIVAYTDHKLIEYSLKKLRYTKWSETLSNPSTLGTRWWGRMIPIIGLTFHPELPHLIMAHDDCGVYIINKNAEVEEERAAKIPKKKNANKDSKLCCTVKKYKHLVAAGWVYDKNNEAEAAIVIVEPTTLLDNLPPAFYKQRFGCM